jgi:hypothetical protein
MNNLRYTHSFLDRYNNLLTLELWQKNYVGPVTPLKILKNSIVIQEPAGELTETPVIGTGLSFTIVNTGKIEDYNNLIGGARHDVKVILKRVSDDYYLFEGFLLPVLYNQAVKHNSDIEITCSNQLAQLQEIHLDNKTDYVTLITLIKECIAKTGISRDLYIRNTIYNEFYTEIFDIQKTLYDHTWVSTEYSNDKTCYQLLEDILRLSFSRLYYHNKAWYIERIKDAEAEPKYKVYHTNGTVSIVNVPLNVVDVSAQYLIKDACTLNYNAAAGKYEMNLHDDEMTDLVNSDMSGIAYNPFYSLSQISTYYNSQSPENYIFAFAVPLRHRWEHSSDWVKILNTNYSDINIKSGISFTPTTGTFVLQPWLVEYNIADLNGISTSIFVDFNRPQKLEIRFSLSVKEFNFNNYRVQYALRYKLADNTVRFIYINDYGLTRVTPFFTPFKVVVDKDTLLRNNGLITVNQSIDISEVLDLIYSELLTEEILHLQLDIYFLQATLKNDFYAFMNGFTFEQYYTYLTTNIGDILVNGELLKAANYYEVDLVDKENYSTKTINLNLFDYSSINVKNSLLFKKADGTYALSKKWQEDRYDYKRDIQIMLLVDLIQLYNQNRYKANFDMISTAGIFKFSDMLTMLDKKFLIASKDYYPESNTYTLQMQEWIDDDGYYLIEEYDLETRWLNVTPLFANLLAFTDFYLELVITSNIAYTIEIIFDQPDSAWWLQFVHPFDANSYGDKSVFFDVLPPYVPGKHEMNVLTAVIKIKSQYFPDIDIDVSLQPPHEELFF